MNTALPEMLHSLNIPGNIAGNIAGVKGMEMSVLERQRLILNWQQEQLLQEHPHHNHHHQSCFNELSMLSFPQGFHCNPSPSPSPAQGGPTLNELLIRPVKPDPGVENRWMEIGMMVENSGVDSVGQVDSSGYGMNYAVSRTASCPPLEVAAAAIRAAANDEARGRDQSPTSADQKLTGSAKKRKVSPKQVDELEDSRSKKSKGCVEEEESKITEQNSHNRQSNHRGNIGKTNEKIIREISGCTSKDNSKASDDQKPDYIHVRARRGQATDSHSLAERVRREKISERMKYLQDLVPGCNKITGKAGMLDEIINYVQSLQRQVEFLSMKLAAVNPRLDFSLDDLLAKEMFAACSTSPPLMGVSQDISNPSYLQYYPVVQQMDPVCGSQGAVNQIDMALRRATSAPVTMPDTFIDTTCFNQTPNSLPWDEDLQNIYAMEFQQGRLTSFPLQTFTGTIEGSSLKTEM